MTNEQRIIEAARLLTEVSESTGLTLSLRTRTPDDLIRHRQYTVAVQRNLGPQGHHEGTAPDTVYLAALECLDDKVTEALDRAQFEREYAERRRSTHRMAA